MPDPFDSAWLKWGRAVVHAQTLDQQLAIETQNFEARHPYTARTEYNPKRHCVSLKLETITPLSPNLGLLVGDAANNFRSSLDHLAWALITTRPKRPPTPKELARTYFPLARSQKIFDAHLLPAHLLSDKDKRVVRRYQPFWSTPRSKPLAERKIDFHCLSVLPEVNRNDKHRTVQPVWAWPRGGKLYVGDPVDCTITRRPERARGIVLEPGAEIQRVYVKQTGPNPDVYMEAHLSVQPTLDGRIELVDWLTQTTGHIRDLLLKFADPPNEITRLGIIPGPQPPA
jgi:hypothetical protein